MRMHPFHRTELLAGPDGFAKLRATSACVIGLGGVGSYAAEALIRSGIGHLTLVDFDRVCITNVNRQLHATRKTTGKFKANLMGERCTQIDPTCDVRVLNTFYDERTADDVLDRPYDLVLDCIDNMTAKVDLLTRCHKRGQYVVSSMGVGARFDPTQVRVTDISKTKNDPMARIVRDMLRQRGVTQGITTVWTEELPNELDQGAADAFRCICPDKDLKQRHSCESRFVIQGTTSWMPAIFGMTLAGTAINHVLGRSVADGNQPAQLRQKPALGKPTPERRHALLKSVGLE